MVYRIFNGKKYYLKAQAKIDEAQHIAKKHKAKGDLVRIDKGKAKESWCYIYAKEKKRDPTTDFK